ncbi:MAG TPA: CYTH domain-containing protein [Adhaeribacter sp.]|nr:CYTH domain-containing protein [Adhaeribacter sp.]
MPIEIERKFLVDEAKWKALPKPIGRFIRQGYMLTDPDKTVRVRLTDKGGFLTIKGRNVGATRPEYEYQIPNKDAHELLDQFTQNDLTKTRYKIKHAGKTWEIDEFSGENKGLIIAEIELNREDETFELPDWVSQEVTGEKKYYNSRLTENPYNTWQE